MQVRTMQTECGKILQVPLLMSVLSAKIHTQITEAEGALTARFPHPGSYPIYQIHSSAKVSQSAPLSTI